MLEKAPGCIRVTSLLRWGRTHQVRIGDVWYPARPLGYYSLRWRLKAAWWAFIGKADVLLWPGDQ